MTCIGNSGPLSEPVSEAIEKVNGILYEIVCTVLLNEFWIISNSSSQKGKTCKGLCFVFDCLSVAFQGDLVAVGVLSGNRNFEGRIHPLTRANYLASPPLVIAYAIAGTVLIDFEKEPLGKAILPHLYHTTLCHFCRVCTAPGIPVKLLEFENFLPGENSWKILFYCTDSWNNSWN